MLALSTIDACVLGYVVALLVAAYAIVFIAIVLLDAFMYPDPDDNRLIAKRGSRVMPDRPWERK